MSKLLTISVAAYNVEGYLDETLKSFANDEYRDLLEVFVVDDGGKDGSLKIAQRYAEEYPEIFVPVHKENGGWGSTVNYSINHASGKYFKLLDGDDYFNASALKEYIGFLQTCDSDCVYTPFNTFEDGSKKVVDTVNLPEAMENCKEYLLEDVASVILMQMHLMTFKTEILQLNHISISEHCFYTDIEYILKALYYVNTISGFDCNLYQYRIARAGQSVSRLGYVKHYKEHITVLKNLIELFPKSSQCSSKYKMITDRVQLMLFTQYNIFYFLKPDRSSKNEIRQFDDWLKSNREYYDNAAFYIKLARKLNFNCFFVLYFARLILSGNESRIKSLIKH